MTGKDDLLAEGDKLMKSAIDALEKGDAELSRELHDKAVEKYKEAGVW